jgi:hypothetical protein
VPSVPVSATSSAGKIALLVDPPAAACWHWRHQHWRTVTGCEAEIVALTAPQAQRPEKDMDAISRQA